MVSIGLLRESPSMVLGPLEVRDLSSGTEQCLRVLCAWLCAEHRFYAEIAAHRTKLPCLF